MRGPVLSLSADRSTANQAIFRNPPSERVSTPCAGTVRQSASVVAGSIERNLALAGPINPPLGLPQRIADPTTLGAPTAAFSPTAPGPPA